MAKATLPFERRRQIEHVGKTRVIDGKKLEIKFIEDNSAPCSYCVFLDSKLKCTFPRNYDKECSNERGTHKGWNTFEYIELVDI